MHFDEAAIECHLQTWNWLMQNFGGVQELRKRELILPTPQFFPERPRNEHAFAEELFQNVKVRLGMEEWPCSLVGFSESHPLARAGLPASADDIAGIFSVGEEGVTIGYAARNLDNPPVLIATLVHELSHYLLRTARSTPPDGWKNHEVHTDITCCFLGFGIFMANAAFDFRQWTDQLMSGWRTSTLGYLSESEYAFAIAVFCLLSGNSPKDASAQLKPNPREHFKQALKELENWRGELEEIAKSRVLSPDLPPILSTGPAIYDTERPAAAVFEAKCVALEPASLCIAILSDFYSLLCDQQPGDTQEDHEFAALSVLKPLLKNAVLMARFSSQFESQGLQGAIVFSEDVTEAAVYKMLKDTALAFESIRCWAQAEFLQNLLPSVSVHFKVLSEWESQPDPPEFISPLDEDEKWQALDLSWHSSLRSRLQAEPESYSFP